MSGLELPRFVPEPPAPVYQVSVAPSPAIPFAVKSVVAFAHMAVIPPVAVILVIAGIAVELIVILASTAGEQVPVTLA